MGKRGIPVILTEEEQNRLLDQFNTRYVTSHRNRVMVQLMLNTGLRVSPDFIKARRTVSVATLLPEPELVSARITPLHSS